MSVPQSSLGLFTAPTQSPTGQTGTTGQTGSGALTTSDFLNLLVSELQNQDPLSPSDSNTFMQQMSTLTDVSAIGQMTQSVANLAAMTESQSAIALVGKTVTLASGGATVTGTVTGVQAAAGGPQLLVDSGLYPLSAVTSVGAAPPSGGTGASAAGNVP
jgi:flagellar basal-body rod modification protein FlgD